MTGRLDALPVDALAPLVLLGFASNILTALPDVEADRAADKRSWPVRRGEATARRDALVLVGLGILLASQVGPSLPPVWAAAYTVPSGLVAVVALRWIRRADAARRDDCLRFVMLATGAAILLQLAWSAALFLGPR